MMEGNIRHVQQLVRSILQRFYIDEMKDLKSNHLNSFLENQHQKQFHACLILLLAKPINFFLLNNPFHLTASEIIGK